MTIELQHAPILVVGAGIMGAGIAQVAAQAGHAVLLHDARAGAAADAKGKLAKTLDGLVAKGKLGADAAAATLSRIEPIAALEAAASAGLVVEAIVEQLDAKRALLRQLEDIVGADCVLASNTSSISVSAIANGLRHPGRVVGMHFFNPVPVMKLVEVVSGLQTDPEVAGAVHALASAWGKVPVHARSTPGFIVNRIARPYYAEALALLLERAATPAVVDACLRGAGFRMGPCELIDLIGHDTNFAVTQSVYEANFYDKRFVPSLVQREMVAGGLYGRKSGQGFFRYVDGKAVGAELPAEAAPPRPAAARVALHGSGPVAERLAAALQRSGVAFERGAAADWTGLAIDGGRLALTDGRSAAAVAFASGVADTALFDFPAPVDAAQPALGWTAAATASPAWQQAAPAWLHALGWAPQRIADAPGLVVARTVAMLVAEAADAVQQGVCTPDEADTAMKLGLNYPAGPFEWLARWDARSVVALIDHLDAHYRGERYRVGGWLRQRAWSAA
jgi:3-hydroxybutyryl-CoA dehydrogenase